MTSTLVDPAFLTKSLVELAQIPAAAPLGQHTLIDPDDPILVSYVQQHLRPRFLEAGAYHLLDLPRNQFAVRFGNGEGPCLALMAYTPVQHHNLMADPLSGRIRVPTELGIDEPCLFGQGVTQNKAHQACLLELARWLAGEAAPLGGTLYLCLNNEGRSSHDCSTAILDSLPRRPDLVIELFHTGFDISVGNRGRVDVAISIDGSTSHSSQPPVSGVVIPAATRVLTQLEAVDSRLREHRHPELGTEQAVPYLVSFDPMAPHTLPRHAQIIVDRRLLPGTSPQQAAEEIRDELASVPLNGCTLRVEAGVHMLPTLLTELDPEMTSIRALEAAIGQHTGAPARHTIHGGTFDAGGPASRGVPTVMFGLPDDGELLGDDFVRLRHLQLEATILASTVETFFP